MWRSLLDMLPRGYTLEDKDWQRRHRLLLWVLLAHLPGLALFGVAFGHSAWTIAGVLVIPAAGLVLGHRLSQYRRTASVLVTGGLVYSSAALVGLTGGAIEAHFHFFIIIGFIALYQDWAPFLFNILFTVISHGVGSIWQQSLIFNHAAGQGNPWLWSLIHGVAVLFACVGMMLFWRVTEESQQEKDALARRLAESEIGRRQFTADLLVNLARRNQSMLYRQLDIINQLEESERDPDALAELFKLDHLATRVRRNAESLLVLSGEQPPRTWSEPVPLRDVLRAAIAETEDLERVAFVVDEGAAITGHAVTDLTHLLAELTENAVRFSPPDSVVTIRVRENRQDPGGQLLTVEDWGVGMPTVQLTEANALLADPPEVDLSVSQRLGLHVVARLAARHGIGVTLSATPGSGITAVIVLPSALLAPEQPATPPAADRHARRERVEADRANAAARQPGAATATLTREPPIDAPARPDGPVPAGAPGPWHGWWEPGVDREPAPPPASIPAPRPVPAAPADPVTGLRRRVPQAHLAPELRQPPGAVGDPAARPAPEAANALSRYQASRQAARAITDGDGEERS